MTGRLPPEPGNVWHHGGADAPRRRPQTGRGRRPARGAQRWLAAAGYSGLALVGLCLAAFTFVLVAPPLGAVRDRLIDDVKARSGRTLSVAGPMSVTLFPRVVVSLSEVAIWPPEGMEGTVTVPSVDAEVSLWSLISRRPRLGRVTLNRPLIELVVDAQGRRSWDPAAPPRRSAQPPLVERTDADRALPGTAEAKASARPRRLRPLALRVVDATLRYRDERSGARHEIGSLDIDVAADEVGGAAISASFVWQDVPLSFSGTLSPDVILERRPGQVAFKLAGAPVEAVYEGSLGLDGGIVAEGELTLQHLIYKSLRIGPAALAVSVSGGGVKLTLRDAELYGGKAQGSLTLDGTGPAPAMATDLRLADASVRPLLGDVAGVAWLDGRGTVALALSAQGQSERQILETLQGKVQIAVVDGTLTGVDIDKTIRSLQRGRLGNLAPRPDDRTPFSSLTATFDIADGIAKSQDFSLASTRVQVQGDGAVELVPRRIDYTLNTKIMGGTPDEGAAINIGSLEIPIGVKGPLERPEFTIKGQEGLTDALKQIGRNLKSREVQDAIKGLLSGDREKRAKPGELIDKLLKKE